MKKTKIVCTLGPSSSSEEVLGQMLRAGMNVARLNFSHGTHEEHLRLIETFRRVRDELGYPAAVMLDTRGPEVRIGEVKPDTVLQDGAPFVLTTKNCVGDEKRCAVNCAKLPEWLHPGDTVLIEDGRRRFRVNEIADGEIRCTVERGGQLRSRQGVNVPNVSLGLPYLSEQDKSDLLFGIRNDVDFIAGSFTRSAEDVRMLRRFLDYHGGHQIRIIAKIENSEGIRNFDEILAEADGIMVARGDMGVEVEYERLPGLQKKFIRKCYQAGKMAITATQMLESMIHSPTPTRAEITDVANAVFDGTSAVMLSGETAMGEYPVEVVRVMAKIAEQAEQDAFEMHVFENIPYEMDAADTTNAICDAACTTARDLRAAAVIGVTKYGSTARRMSKFRPLVPIVAATPEPKTFHQLALSWGVYPALALYQEDVNALFLHAIACAQNLGLVKDGDRVVITAGTPLNESGRTNIMKVQTVGHI